MDMDYNYVRMRNALHNEDFEAAENYKRLYESGKEKRRALLGIDYVIIILFLISSLFTQNRFYQSRSFLISLGGYASLLLLLPIR